ncbi:MAG: DUF4249 domain-containing protein [Bacteroidales bacterium]|nr:MAG: DUF4249 domain-containing protein [Bacteroidales bacterium]
MIKYFKILLYTTLILIIVANCIDPFYPDIEEYENVLVVDGFITNENSVYKVKLSRTQHFDDAENKPVPGAVVQVIDDSGNVYLFRETKTGTYESNPGEFTGQVGRKYKLNIETTDGNKYESGFEGMKNIPEIDSIYWEYKEKPASDVNNPYRGIQILIDTHDPENKTRYYRWSWSETWEFVTPYHKDTLPRHCWKKDSSRVIEISSTDHLTEDIIRNYPLYFISEGTNRLSIRYSILVRQYSLTSDCFNYWSRIRETNENTGTLFDPIPTQVIGNITDLNNPDKPVLGYFQASAVASKRIFIDRSELIALPLSVSSGFEYCESLIVKDSLDNPRPEYLGYVENYGWVIYFQEVSGPILVTYLTNSISCVDCSLTGTPVKPDFWIE